MEPLTAGMWRCRASTPWGPELSWDVLTTATEKDRLLAWCGVEGGTLPGAAEVRLNAGPYGTEVHVDAWLVPPAARFLSPVLRRAEASRPLRRAGLAPSQQLQQELRRLRQLLEAGETATISGQSSGRRSHETIGERAVGLPLPERPAVAGPARGRGGEPEAVPHREPT